MSETVAIDAINKMIAGGALGQARSPLVDLANAYHSLTATQRLTTLEGRNLADYQATMAERTGKKLAVMEDWLPKEAGASIVDVGTGTGHVPAALAKKYPRSKFIGVDLSPEMVAAAQSAHKDSGATYHQVGADGKWPGGPHHAATFVSVIHEVYSYAGEGAFKGMLKNTHDNLTKGGRIIIKDFNGPAEPNKIVVLNQAREKLRDSNLTPYSFSDFVRAIKELRGDVNIKIKKVTDKEIQYETPMWLAYEYMYHLKYLKTSPKEVMEKYGFWNAASAKKSLEDAGFKVLHVKEFDDGNVVETRLKGSLSLSDPKTGDAIDYPIRKLLIVGEKP